MANSVSGLACVAGPAAANPAGNARAKQTALAIKFGLIGSVLFVRY
jgi:hypothetical protein